MTPRRQYLVFFGLVLAVAGATVAFGRRGSPAARAVLAAVPRDAWLVVAIDVAALRTSPLAAAALGPAAARAAIPGLGPLASACGFEPLEHVRELVVAVPDAASGSGRGDFGVAFSSDLTREELAACAAKVIQSRGGDPSRTARGAFTVVEDARGSGDAGADHRARFAYREGGLSLVARGAWLDAMIDAVGSPGSEAPGHAELREALRSASVTGKDAAAAPLVLTALLPKQVRDQLKAEMATEVGGGGGDAPGDAAGSFSGVLAVDRAGLAIATGAPGSVTDVTLELHCETPAACADVGRLIERKRLALSRDFGARVAGLGPMVDALTVEARGPTLTAKTRGSTDDLARTLRALLGPDSR